MAGSKVWVAAATISVVIVAAGLSVMYFSGFFGTGPTPSPTPSVSPSSSPTATITVTLYGGEISSTNYGFGNSSNSLTSPGPTLTFKVGDVVKVTFYNVGQNPHAWAITTSKASSSQVLFSAEIGSGTNPIAPGSSGSVTFTVTQAGNFFYICTVPGHSDLGMWGNVIVTS